MNRKALPALAAVFAFSLGASALQAQEAPLPPAAPPSPAVAPAPPAPPAPFAMSLFADGDNFLGIHAEELTSENAGRFGGAQSGVGVARVVKDGPAAQAGLREGDVILRFDGEEVSSVRKLNRLIDEAAPGHTARLRVRRAGGGEQEVSVKLARRRDFARGLGVLEGELAWPDSESWRRQGEELRRQGEEMRRQFERMGRDNPGTFALAFGGGRRIGVATMPLGKQLADYFGVAQGEGVLVSSVEEGSPADKAGLKAGDVITEADGERVNEPGDLARALNRKEEGEVTLTVVRERKQRTFKVTPERRSPSSFNINVPPVLVETPAVSVTLPRIRVTPPRVITVPRVRVNPARVIRQTTIL